MKELKPIAIVITMALFLSIAAKSYGQQLKTYEGEYNKGSAKYTYYEKDGERVLQGKFVYVNDQTVGNAYASVREYHTVQGNYENGKRVGEWVERDINYNSRFTAILIKNIFDFRIIEVGDPTVIDWFDEVKKNYKNGIADGSFSCKRTKYVGGKGQITQQTKGSLKNGDYFTGHYSSFNMFNYKVEGNFDNEGYYDGKWSIIDPIKENEETKVYDHGVLTQQRIISPQTGQAIYKYDNRIYQTVHTLMPSYIEVTTTRVKPDHPELDMALNIINSEEAKDLGSATGYIKKYHFKPKNASDSIPSIAAQIDKIVSENEKVKKENYQQNVEFSKRIADKDALDAQLRKLNTQKSTFEITHTDINHKQIQDVPFEYRFKDIQVRQKYIDDENARMDNDPSVKAQRATLQGYIKSIDSIKTVIANKQSNSSSSNSTQNSLSNIDSNVFGYYIELVPSMSLILLIKSIKWEYARAGTLSINFPLEYNLIKDNETISKIRDINDAGNNHWANVGEDYQDNIQLLFEDGVITGTFVSINKDVKYDFIFFQSGEIRKHEKDVSAAVNNNTDTTNALKIAPNENVSANATGDAIKGGVTPSESPVIDDITGEWKGAFGKNQLSLVIQKMDNGTTTGYNTVKNESRPLSGTYSMTNGDYQLVLAEPGDKEWDGKFTMTYNHTSKAITGSWKANNGKLTHDFILMK